MTRANFFILALVGLCATGCPDDEPPAADGSTGATGFECATGGTCTEGAAGASTAAGQPDDGDTTDGGTTQANDGVLDDTGADECVISSECGPDFCVAPFNPDLGVFGRGDFECVAACVEALDEFRWCADAAACCNPDATCTDRGYCELPEVADGSTGAGSSGTDSTGEGSTGADGDESDSGSSTSG